MIKSISESRALYHWRLAKRGGTYLVGSLVAAGVAGALAAAANHATRMAALGLSPTVGLVGFVALALVSGLSWSKFSTLQDEMFRRIQNYSYGWALPSAWRSCRCGAWPMPPAWQRRSIRWRR